MTSPIDQAIAALEPLKYLADQYDREPNYAPNACPIVASL